MPIKKKSSTPEQDRYDPVNERPRTRPSSSEEARRPRSRAEVRGTLTEQEAEVIDEEEADAKDLEEWEEEEVQPRSRPYGNRRPAHQQAQSRKTTRHNNSSSTHNYREWNDVRFKGYLGRSGIEFKVNADGDPWCYFTLNVSQGKGKMPAFINITVFDSGLTEYLDANEKYLSGQDRDSRLLVLGQWRMRKSDSGTYYQGCVADHVEVID